MSEQNTLTLNIEDRVSLLEQRIASNELVFANIFSQLSAIEQSLKLPVQQTNSNTNTSESTRVCDK